MSKIKYNSVNIFKLLSTNNIFYRFLIVLSVFPSTLSTFQWKYYKAHQKTKIQFEEIKQVSEPKSDMKGMLELLYQESEKEKTHTKQNYE